MSGAESVDPVEPTESTSESTSASSSASFSSRSSDGEPTEQPIVELVFADASGRQIRLFGAGEERVYEVSGAQLVLRQHNQISFTKTSVFGAGFPAVHLSTGAFGVYGRRVYGLSPFRECARLPFETEAFQVASFNDKIAILCGDALRFFDAGTASLIKSTFQPPVRFLQATRLAAFAETLFFVPRFGGVVGMLRGSTFEERYLGSWFSAQLVNVVGSLMFLEIDQQETVLVDLDTMRVRRAGRVIKEVAWSYKVADHLIYRDNGSALFADVLASFK